MIWRALAASIATLALAPGMAQAQAYQCQIPRGSFSVPAVQRDGPARQVPITGYTLSLSWSPEYCRGRERRAGDSRQCSGRSGRFGFVVHGLWPEGRGTWPQWCPASRQPSSAELARNLCMTPSVGLLAREWAKHGSCMTQRPESYFKVTRILWSSLRWPDFDRIARSDALTAGDIREAFAQANRYWKPEHIGLAVNDRGWVEEMRLCYGKDFMPAKCGKQRYGPADSEPVKVWRGL
ncbi:ribonuclease T2 family protein [Croceibacterium selenioxidans]